MSKYAFTIDKALLAEITRGEDRTLAMTFDETDEDGVIDSVDFTDVDEVILKCPHRIDGVIKLRSVVGNAFVPADVDLDLDCFNIVDHGFAEGQVIRFFADNTLPTGVVAATDYYVKRLTRDAFQVSATLGGDAINLTAVGSGSNRAGIVALTVTDANDGELSVVLSDAITSDLKAGPKQPMELSYTKDGTTQVIRMEKSLTVFEALD